MNGGVEAGACGGDTGCLLRCGGRTLLGRAVCEESAGFAALQVVQIPRVASLRLG